jgi:WD40 repeat protein/serine/threonine protein kinase
MDMSAGGVCEKCGAIIPADSPGGLCGPCLLRLGLEPHAGDPGDGEGRGQSAGDRIGRYRLLEEIGHGGCGVVYLAEQEEPVHRRVALKVIKLGMDTRQVVARFAAERQALALMDHPNIAKVLDAGATESGRPYFVMELVHGLRITDFCDQHQVSTGDRLKLFTQVCLAVQHAHQKGIIHRDLKPSNILVTLHDGVPVPKVIDFGIAKATQGRLADQTLFTAFEQFLGTPAYMSPEQAGLSDLDIDTRSDIYSLGVLLYELLIGTTPFDARELTSQGIDAMRRAIREQEPVRPSTRLTQELARLGSAPAPGAAVGASPTAPSPGPRAKAIRPPAFPRAGSRGREPGTPEAGVLPGLSGPDGSEAGALLEVQGQQRLRLREQIKRVRGDLDWIVMKCLEKDRSRRYETANGLARDLERHLNHEPVVARPPSTVYRLQRFGRRNRVLVTAAAVATALLVLGVLAITREAVRANNAERAQSRLATEARQQEQATRLRAYASEVSVALQAWEAGNPSRARALLERQRPQPEEEDLRGFEWRYLHGLFAPREVRTLAVKEGTREVWASAWSPDGKHAALGGLFGNVELWDWAAQQRVGTIPAWGLVVYSLAFLRDGRTLACPFATEPPTNPQVDQVGVALWDLETLQITDRFLTAAGGFPFIAVGHQGRLLALLTGSGYDVGFQGKIVICDLTRQAPPFELAGHPASPLSSDFSADDRWLATSHGDGTVIVWDVEQRRELKRLVGHRGQVFKARFAPGGWRLATGGVDGTVRLWELGDFSSPVRASILGYHQSTVFGLDFSPDGRLLVSASLDHTAKVWDVAAWKEIETLRGHDQRVFSASFSPDGQFILTGSEDDTAKVWRTPARASTEPLDRHGSERYTALEFSPDGRWLLAGETNHTKLWEVASRARFTLELVNGRFAPDRTRLAGLNDEGRLTLWDISGTQPHRVMTLTNTPPFRLDRELAFAPDGQTLAGVQTNGQVAIWSLTEAVPRLLRLFTNDLATGSPVFSPDGRMLAFASATHGLVLWDWREDRPVARLQERTPAKELQAYAFSPDGRVLLTQRPSSSLFWDQTIRLWDASGWQPIEEVQGEHYAFSADNRWLATGSGMRTQIGLRDRTSGTSYELSSGSGPVDCLAFSPDNLTLAVATRDGWVNLWHLPSRQEILSLKAHRSHAWRAVFSPDRRTLATAGADGNLRLWTAPTIEETDRGRESVKGPGDRR